MSDQSYSHRNSYSQLDDFTIDLRESTNFIFKAYDIVSNPKNSKIIHWTKTGNSFVIENIDLFVKQILPQYFRHNRYQSFVRQLNMYDFHKIRNGDNYCQNSSQFKHCLFSRGNFARLAEIRRKNYQEKVQKKSVKVSRKEVKNKTKSIVRKMNREKRVKNENIASLRIREQYEDDVSIQSQIQVLNLTMEECQLLMKGVVSEICEMLNREDRFLYKNSIMVEAVDLAELIKEKWGSRAFKYHFLDHAKFMKIIYYRIKDEVWESLSNPLELAEEENAIINSIFRTEMKSTLVCINSDTFLNNCPQARKFDTFLAL